VILMILSLLSGIFLFLFVPKLIESIRKKKQKRKKKKFVKHLLEFAGKNKDEQGYLVVPLSEALHSGLIDLKDIQCDETLH